MRRSPLYARMIFHPVTLVIAIFIATLPIIAEQ